MMSALRRMELTIQEPVMATLETTITCPECGSASQETMPTDACRYVYQCKSCGATLKPKSGDCCVYCSYADVPCPPVQETRSGRRIERDA